MTHTPVERAKALASQIEGRCCNFAGILDFNNELAARFIAQAIREAEDAALDKAITCVRDNFVNDEGHYAIEAILSLKHKKETQP